jgi:hypothetical protein
VQYTGRVEKHRLLDVSRRAIDPAEGGERGPAGAPISGNIYTELLDRRVRIISNLPNMTEKEFEAAREFWRYVAADYSINWPRFADDADIGFLFAEWTQNVEIIEACDTLVDCLGMIIYGAFADE